MIKLKLDIPESFLREEERCAHIVTREMKELWAVELDLLSEFKRVCEKYNLYFSADSGTLLGAVRHKGFIPWDNDIDIFMLREDYESLCRIAPEEFKVPYSLVTYKEDCRSSMGFAKLYNLHTTAIENPYINRIQGIFIDIFPLDNVPDDIKLFEQQKKDVFRLARTLGRLTYCTLAYNIKEPAPVVKKIGRIILHFYYLLTKRGRKYGLSLFKAYEVACKRYNTIPTKYVAAISYYTLKTKDLVRRTDFLNPIEVDFEFIKIPIIQHYDEYLKSLYGNYMVFIKGTELHTLFMIDTNKPYVHYLK